MEYKYFADFSLNNGTHLLEPLRGNNKRKLISMIYNLCIANRFMGSKAEWLVKDNCGNVVASGYITDKGSFRN